MKKIAILVLLVFSLSIFSGCAPQTVRPDGTTSGSNVGYCALGGAAAGAGIGALTRLKKPLANMIVGALVGAVTGAVVCDIIEKKSQQAALEAARTKRVVQYRTDQGQIVKATPVAQTSDGCQEIMNEAFDTDGTSLGKVPRTVCPGQNGPEIKS